MAQIHINPFALRVLGLLFIELMEKLPCLVKLDVEGLVVVIYVHV